MKIRFTQNKRTILKLLKTASLKKKLRMIERFNGFNERDTISILLKVLEDSSWVMREKAAMKLIEYGNRVVPRLERLLGRGYWYTRAAACITLGGIGNPRSMKAIVQVLLQDDNPTVQKEALQAIVSILRNDLSILRENFEKMDLNKEDYVRVYALIKEFDPELISLIDNAS